jgi:hypothetical protein
LVKSFKFSFESKLEDFTETLEKRILEVKEDLLKKVLEDNKKAISDDLEQSLQRIIEKPDKEMWPKIRERFDSLVIEHHDKFTEELKGFDLTEKEIQKTLTEMKDNSKKALKERLLDQVKHINEIMKKKFDSTFSFDPDGLPRRWKPEDDVKGLFKIASVKGEEVLEALCIMRLTPLSMMCPT